MADNIQLNPGLDGDVLATDEISGVQHQRVKIQHGADGSATDVSDASPLPSQVTAEYLYSDYQSSLADAGIIDSGWIDTGTVCKIQIEALSSASTGTNIIVDSSILSGGSGSTISTTTAMSAVAYVVQQIPQQRYIRVRFQNSTGGPITDASLAVKAFYGSP